MSDSLRPGESAGLLLWRTTLLWQRQVTAALKPLGLTHVQFVLLASTWWLDRQAEQQPNQRAIAQHAATDPMMTSQVLRTLETKGLVRRDPDPQDSRARRVSVTDEGAALAREAIRVVESVDRAFFEAAPSQAALVEALTALSS